MARPAKYRNAAERQKAYRERNKPQPVDHPFADVIAEVENRRVTLLQTVTKYSALGRDVKIYMDTRANYASVRDDMSLMLTVNPLVVLHMINCGELALVRRDAFGAYYQLQS